MKKIKYCLIIFGLFCLLPMRSQNMEGIVIDSTTSKPIQYVNVLYFKSASDSIIDYTVTDESGKFSLALSQEFGYLEFRMMSYDLKRYEIIESDLNESLIVTLKPVTTELEEVILRYTRPIVHKKDTVVFDVSSFTNGNEQVVEDVLSNIPGLTVDNEGTIKVGFKEIEKIMVDGDDFFGKGYKLISKNMPAYSINKVEIIEDYHENEFKKGLTKSDKIALNIKLDKNYKSKWFGNIAFGMDFKHGKMAKIRGNFMNFKERLKIYLLSKRSKDHIKISDEIEKLLFEMNASELPDVHNKNQKKEVFSLKNNYLPIDNKFFEKIKTNLISPNFIVHLNKKIKSKAALFLSKEGVELESSRFEQIYLNDLAVSRNHFSKYNAIKKSFIGFFKTDYSLKSNAKIEVISKFEFSEKTVVNKLENENLNYTPILNTTLKFVDHQFSYYNKIKENSILSASLKCGKENYPEVFEMNHGYSLSDSMDDLNIINTNQNLSKNQSHQLADIEYLFRTLKGNQYVLKGSYTGNTMSFNSNLNMLALSENSELQNTYFENINTNKSRKIKFTIGQTINKRKFSWTSRVSFNNYYSILKQSETISTNKENYLDFYSSFSWKPNDKNSLSFSHSTSKKDPFISKYVLHPIASGYNSFYFGKLKNQLLSSSFSLLNYQLGKFFDPFFWNIIAFQSVNHDFLSYNHTVYRNHTISEVKPFENKVYKSTEIQLNKFVKKISSNIKGSFGYSYNNYKNQINNSSVMNYESESLRTGIELKSGFDQWFNLNAGVKYSNDLGKNMKLDKSNTFEYYIDFLFTLPNSFNAELSYDGYNYENSATTDNSNRTYHFLNAKFEIELLANKCSLQIEARNLLDENKFITSFYNNYSQTDFIQKLIGRELLINLLYRF